MQVTFISACQKKAISRTRSILDRYAYRMGDSIWSTFITQEGLQSLRIHLKSNASKNTAVLCLLEDKKRGMVPLWIVGRRSAFGEDWRTPVWVTEKPIRERTIDQKTLPDWMVKVKKTAAISGLFHDLGKNNRFFSEKILQDYPIADPVRHEWISTRLIEALWEHPESSLDELWRDIVFSSKGTAYQFKIHKNEHPLCTISQNIYTSIISCVATHHRLLSEDRNLLMIDAKNMMNEKSNKNDKNASKSLPAELIEKKAGPFPETIVNKVNKVINDLRMADSYTGNPLYWRGITFMARIALILADHQVSSKRADLHECPHMDSIAPFANSIKNDQGKRIYNQSLPWHLQSVGEQAGAMADRLYRLDNHLEGICQESMDSVDETAKDRFEWQEKAATAISKMRQLHPEKPFLIAVISGTGSGKTRACARLAVRAAINPEKIRWTSLFNLRTLTLQTGSAYRHQLGIHAEDMSVVIGDAWMRKAVEAQENSDMENEDGMNRDLGEEISIEGANYDLPEWLQHFVKNDNNLQELIAAPVFVSTADYLVPAGEPNMQGRHIMPLMRLMYSDLILDEVDNYDARSVVAILRLVQLSGFFGRNVIASSATMTPALADALGKFYAHGASMRAALNEKNEPDFGCAVFSDLAEPSLQEKGDKNKFYDLFNEHIEALKNALKEKENIVRKAIMIPVKRNENGFNESFIEPILEFHKQHQWIDKPSGKPLSVGLIRVANIKTAIELTRYLREHLHHAYPQIACYHSQLFTGHRLLLERDLDKMLLRSGERADAPSLHPSVRRHMERDTVKSGLFIVVATPVEEVGRDHDFDWAIIEPSSAQSIVQTSGRVNRHRQYPIEHPNIGICQYNLRTCKSGQSNAVAFIYPGNETIENRTEFGNHDMTDLVDWSLLNNTLDARLRFDTEHHVLSRIDEKSLEENLKQPIFRMTETQPENHFLWLSEFTYKNWPLRSIQYNEECRYDPEEDQWYIHSKYKGKWSWLPQGNDSTKKITSTWKKNRYRWLSPDHSEIQSYCVENGLDEWTAFTVNLPVYPDKNKNSNEDKKQEKNKKWECSYDGIAKSL